MRNHPTRSYPMRGYHIGFHKAACASDSGPERVVIRCYSLPLYVTGSTSAPCESCLAQHSSIWGLFRRPTLCRMPSYDLPSQHLGSPDNKAKRLPSDGHLPYLVAFLRQGLTYKGLMIPHPSILLVLIVLKSKSSRTLSVMGRKYKALSRHPFAASLNASISASGGRVFESIKAAHETLEELESQERTKKAEWLGRTYL